MVHTRRALEELGATVAAVERGGSHDILRFVTASGGHGQMHVSKGGVIDPYKIRGWARQSIARADARNRR